MTPEGIMCTIYQHKVVCEVWNVFFFVFLRVYPASEGASQDRLCCGSEDGDPGARDAETRQSAAILVRNANPGKRHGRHSSVSAYEIAEKRSMCVVVVERIKTILVVLKLTLNLADFLSTRLVEVHGKSIVATREKQGSVSHHNYNYNFFSW